MSTAVINVTRAKLYVSAGFAAAMSIMLMACSDISTEPVRRVASSRPVLAVGADIDHSSGTDVTEDHVNACGQSIDLFGAVRYTVSVITDNHGGWHREIMLQEDLSGTAQPSGSEYTGSIAIHETSALPGGDGDDTWPFTHTFHRLVRLSSSTGPDIAVDRQYHVTGTPDQRIVIERSSRVERCGK